MRCHQDGARIDVAFDVYSMHNERGEIGAMTGMVRKSGDRALKQALRSSEQRQALALAVQAARMVIWEWDLQTGRVELSPQVLETPGTVPGDLPCTPDDLLRCVHPEDRDRVVALAEDARRGAHPLDIEFRFVCGDGDVRWFHSVAHVQRNEEGLPSRVVGAVQDVTERGRLVGALRESEERFRLAVRVAPFPILIHAEDGAVLAVNDAWLDGSGYRREQLPTVQAWLDRAFGESSRAMREVFANRFAVSSVTRGGEYLIRTADGRELSWDFISAPLGRTADGHRLLITVAIDVTERREAERALRESRERLQAALSASQTGTYRWEFRSDKVEWDENLFRLWGLPPGPTGPSFDTFLALVHPDDRAAVLERCELCAREGADFIMELRAIMPDGTVRWLDDHGRTFFDDAGRPLYVTGFCVDVTERKNSALALQRAKEEAENASRAKDDFLATLSHELRTPLTAMLGWARMINMKGLRPGLVEEGLSSIERNARAQAQLVEDLLDISRIISGKLQVRLQTMNLRATVETAVVTARPAADAKKITLTVSLTPPAGIFLDGDADRLQQVVANLLGNAVKFTPTGGTVKVALFAEGTVAVLQVSDSGAGIAPEFLPRVFDRFQQADVSTTRRHGGLGLGLAIVRHVVELHGGTVHADSPGVNQGATFTVRLPRCSAAAAELAGSGSAGVRATAVEECLLQGLHVLVVDDEHDARGLVSTVLERAGAKVTAVDSVAGALRALEGPQAGVPHVLVSDIAMPGEDGYALIRRLREAENRGLPRLPAVALTAQARVDDRIRALSAGFQSYVAKPVEPLELVAVVASLAGRTVQ